MDSSEADAPGAVRSGCRSLQCGDRAQSLGSAGPPLVVAATGVSIAIASMTERPNGSSQDGTRALLPGNPRAAGIGTHFAVSARAILAWRRRAVELARFPHIGIAARHW